jgi:hypothetical protein
MKSWLRTTSKDMLMIGRKDHIPECVEAQLWKRPQLKFALSVLIKVLEPISDEIGIWAERGRRKCLGSLIIE